MGKVYGEATDIFLTFPRACGLLNIALLVYFSQLEIPTTRPLDTDFTTFI